MRKAKALSLAIMCASAAHCGMAQAHDLVGLVAEQTALDPAARQKLARMNELRQELAAEARSAAPGNQLEAVVQRTLKWPSDQVTVCFFDGAMPFRDHVAEVAALWTDRTSLRFDFGIPDNRRTCDPNAPSNIRVSFQGSGYWSYVGTQARLIDPQKQTLNLSGLDTHAAFSARDDGVILHEFGHAIGFEHEHQSPQSGCQEEFNWNYLYVALPWPKDEVDRNMRRLDVSVNKNLLVTAFDSKSIMLYSLDIKAFKNPTTAKCYISQPNDSLSDEDERAARSIYLVLGASGDTGSKAAAPAQPATALSTSAAAKIREIIDLLGF
jgi:hypothetical protein